MLLKKIVVASVFFILLITLAIAFGPLPSPSPENTLKTYGTIEEIFEAGQNSIVFKLRGDGRLYYVDQGFKNGRPFSALQAELPGQAVAIYHVKYWALLDPFSKVKHIARVDLNRTTLYSDNK